GYNPTGTITFTLVAPDGTVVDTETVPVNGNGTYTTPTGFTLPSSAATGTYQWDATYSGDGNNNAATDIGTSNEQVTVSAASGQNAGQNGGTDNGHNSGSGSGSAGGQTGGTDSGTNNGQTGGTDGRANGGANSGQTGGTDGGTNGGANGGSNGG